jgi:NitT/TauT family transport system permease protein
MSFTTTIGTKGRNIKFLSIFQLGVMPSKTVRGGLQVTSLLVPFLFWVAIASFDLVDAKFLPSPQAVFRSLLSMAQSGILFQDIVASTGRVFAGFFLATLLAVPIGIYMGVYPALCSLLEPLIAMLRYMPAAAFIPLLIIYLGIGEAPKIALIFIGTLYFNILMVMDAVKFVPKELIETTLTLGGRSRQVLVQVVARYSLPNIIDTLRINIATSWNLVVVAELVAAEVGLGKRIQLAQRFFRTDQIFAELIVLGLIGFAIDMGFRILLRVSCKWAV